MKLKIVTIVGARPQFIKAAAVSRCIRRDYADEIEEILVHTGQHYDHEMSSSFFTELNVPPPKFDLKISEHTHGAMTGRMMEAIERILLQEQPDRVLVYGDTNSTLAGALAAAKLHIPVAHVEAGLRSFNMRMPEEINRIVSDRVSTFLFCPTKRAVENLFAEGITNGVYDVGDVMYDVALLYRGVIFKEGTLSRTLSAFGVEAGKFALATLHRAENTDDPDRLREICLGFARAANVIPIIFPIHPRTRKAIENYGLRDILNQVNVVPPVSFLNMACLQASAKMILTDSGGIQKEAYFYRVPCITVRDETEWVETIECGANRLVGADSAALVRCIDQLIDLTWIPEYNGNPYGDGQAASKIVQVLLGQHTVSADSIIDDKKETLVATG